MTTNAFDIMRTQIIQRVANHCFRSKTISAHNEKCKANLLNLLCYFHIFKSLIIVLLGQP